MATILDVARHAGVGVGTVSRVLNDHPRVAPATRARVLTAIDDLRYRPNPLARGLSIGRSSMITILVPSLASASVAQRMRGAIDALNAQERPVSVVNVETPDQLDRALMDLTGRSRPSGVLVVSLRIPGNYLEEFSAEGIALVMVDVEAEGFHSFTIDDVAGGRLATEHLLSLGHRRIAFLGDAVEQPLRFTSSKQRLEGFRSAMAAHEAQVDEELVLSGVFGFASAHTLTNQLFSLPEPPTAVFAASDTQALGVIEAVRSSGRSVPGDVSVIGFDDLDVAPFVGLTTIHQPLEESGRVGAERMIEVLTGTATEPVNVALELQLVERSSTRSIMAVA